MLTLRQAPGSIKYPVAGLVLSPSCRVPHKRWSAVLLGMPRHADKESFEQPDCSRKKLNAVPGEEVFLLSELGDLPSL